MSTKVSVDIRKLKFWCQKILPLVYDDSLSYYEMLCKLLSYINAFIDKLNEFADILNEFADEFEEFKTQFNEWIETLGGWQATIDGLSADFTKLKTDYTAFQTTVNNQIAALEAKINALPTDITEIVQEVEDALNRITTVEANVTSLYNKPYFKVGNTGDVNSDLDVNDYIYSTSGGYSWKAATPDAMTGRGALLTGRTGAITGSNSATIESVLYAPNIEINSTRLANAKGVYNTVITVANTEVSVDLSAGIYENVQFIIDTPQWKEIYFIASSHTVLKNCTLTTNHQCIARFSSVSFDDCVFDFNTSEIYVRDCSFNKCTITADLLGSDGGAVTLIDCARRYSGSSTTAEPLFDLIEDASPTSLYVKSTINPSADWSAVLGDVFSTEDNGLDILINLDVKSEVELVAPNMNYKEDTDISYVKKLDYSGPCNIFANFKYTDDVTYLAFNYTNSITRVLDTTPLIINNGALIHLYEDTYQLPFPGNLDLIVSMPVTVESSVVTQINAALSAANRGVTFYYVGESSGTMRIIVDLFTKVGVVIYIPD